MMKVCRFLIPCVLAIVVLSAGLVSAYVINTYNGNPIDWTYQANPMGENYLVNENCADCTGEAVAIRNAATTWNNAGAKFTFSYGGATNIANDPILLLMGSTPSIGRQISPPDQPHLRKLLIGTTFHLAILLNAIASLMPTIPGARLQ